MHERIGSGWSLVSGGERDLTQCTDMSWWGLTCVRSVHATPWSVPPSVYIVEKTHINISWLPTLVKLRPQPKTFIAKSNVFKFFWKTSVVYLSNYLPNSLLAKNPLLTVLTVYFAMYVQFTAPSRRQSTCSNKPSLLHPTTLYYHCSIWVTSLTFWVPLSSGFLSVCPVLLRPCTNRHTKIFHAEFKHWRTTPKTTRYRNPQFIYVHLYRGASIYGLSPSMTLMLCQLLGPHASTLSPLFLFLLLTNPYPWYTCVVFFRYYRKYSFFEKWSM